LALIETNAPGANGEIQLTDALKKAMDHEKTYGFLFSGTHFDLGNPYGLLKASIYRALTLGENSEYIKKSLREMIN
jgi:UTP--glucose-1-phosphate uridylyltransferase